MVRAAPEPTLEAIFERDIAPVLFSGEPSDDATLAIVTGAAGAARATARVVGSTGASTAIISNEQLEAFHPDFLHSADPSGALVRDAAVAWGAAAMKRARLERRSLLIEGDGLTAGAVLGTARLFGRDGFRTHIVLVAGSRAETLLAVVSAYARHVRDGTSGTPVHVSAHDADRQNVRAIVSEAAGAEAVDRLTVFSHRGDLVFDRRRSGTESDFDEAAQQLDAVEKARLTALESVEWMSELRRVTEFEMASTRSHPVLVDSLIVLHEIGLNEVVPGLAVPRGSAMVSRQEREYASRLVRLRELRSSSAAAVDLAAPVVVPPSADRDGIGR